MVVAEVKGLTTRDRGFRARLAVRGRLGLALGQVLRYARLLTAKGRPVIATEREPIDSSWTEVCEAAGVTLVSPATFSGLFATATIAPLP